MEETFTHVRTMISMILGLGIAQLLKNAVKLIDHNRLVKPYLLHVLWVFYVFLLMIHFWWWEAQLKTIVHWNFMEYFFLIVYTMLYFALCVLIFPDNIKEYEGFKEYFFSKKRWFFSFLIVIFVADFADTLLKGKDYLESLNWEYPVRNLSHIVLCLMAIRFDNVRFQYILAGVFIVYDISYILRYYYLV
jgi:hypothetical protein